MDKKKMASDCYKKGVEAMEKQNWGLAVEMFGMCSKLVADNVMYRQLLRKSEYKKYDDNKKGAGALAKGKLYSIRGRIKKAKAKEQWEEVDVACEEGLALNPWDVQLNVELGESLVKRDLLDVARFAYLSAVSADPNNKELNWTFAELLEDRGEYDEASKIWERICKLDPDDGTARSKLTGAQTKKTLDHGGYEKADNTRSVRVGKTAKGEAAAPGESLESDLKHAIRKEPERVEAYLKLGEYYRRNKRYDEAHEILEKGAQVSGNNPTVREQLEDVELIRMKENLTRAKERAAEDESAKKIASDLALEYAKRRLEILRTRVERYPQDLTLKLELGQLFMDFKKWNLAIPLLQQASQNNRIKAKALAHLGKCFIHDKKMSLARGQLERAVAELNYQEDPKLFLESHYLLARVYEELGETAKAEEHFGEVLVHDYDYKDARERLEKLQSGDAGS